ncbi:unnamed protein product [Linum tenue]|uniref:Uncharacterized protein n=3 Tax=Linum tenue TaxID=586396 RepID=A0AAV0KNV5_9ROSI|nr:unnamed protein product [Linum tenue]
MGPIPGVKLDEARNRKTWFNMMVDAYMCWDDALNDRKKAVTFGTVATCRRRPSAAARGYFKRRASPFLGRKATSCCSITAPCFTLAIRLTLLEESLLPSASSQMSEERKINVSSY